MQVNYSFHLYQMLKMVWKYIWTDKDKVYTYEIREVKKVTPERVDEIEDREGVNEITLVTCEDKDAIERIIDQRRFKRG